MTVLEITETAIGLAEALVERGALPEKASADALHVAVASAHGITYLLTWNCKHLANVTMRPMIESVCESIGLVAPMICTPDELMEPE